MSYSLQPPENGGQRSALITAPGAQAAEAALLREIAELAEAGRGDFSLLRLPVRVVVPSRSLRDHLCSALVRENGSVAGVVVQTSFQLASEILETTGVVLPEGEELLPVLVARSARAQPILRKCLDPLVGGYAAVEAVVSDLFDAGFESIHAEGAHELVVGEAGAGPFGQRARAVLEVAAELAARIESGTLAHRSVRFARARAELERDSERALSARAVLVFGFADATGVQTDFIEALVRHRNARVYVDQPRDPTHPEQDDAGVAFSRRFRERIAGSVAGAASTPEREVGSRARVRVVQAPGASAEVRAVANRVRELIDRGATPERIGVVARDLAHYRVPLRQHFTRLGVPFSAVGELGPLTAAGRRLRALLAVLRQPSAVPAERWLEAVERFAVSQSLSHTERADLRLALHHRGIARLSDLANFDLGALRGRDGISLPVRRGAVADSKAEHVSGSPRRVLPAALFEAARAISARLLSRLEGWPREAPLQTHVAGLRVLALEDLGWSDAEQSAGALLENLFRVALGSADEQLDWEEFLAYAERVLGTAGRVSLGGSGGGVQVLGVMEARARTFQHLFVLGMNRGAFPRTIAEDPLLSDGLRARLRALLPDLPVKAEGYDEERFLFAELLSASDDVVLSATAFNEEGKPQPVSPLLLRLGPVGAAKPEDAPPLYSDRSAELEGGAGAVLRPASEQAQLAGLYGTRREFRDALTVALEEFATTGAEGSEGAPRSVISAAELSGARVAVLEEFDPGFALRGELGPYFGFVGGIAGPEDPRAAGLSITTLENIGACPWQGFLRRLLHLEVAPDALGDLPDADPRWVGSLAHEVLERLVSRELAASGRPVDTEGFPPKRVSLEAVAALEPVGVEWPEESALDLLLGESAADFARAQGIPLAGFGRVLAALARPLVENARGLGWPAPGSGTGALGVEVDGEVLVPDASGTPRSIRFRVDRVDIAKDALVLVDYKTGKSIGALKKPEGRRSKHLEAVARGAHLQSVAYAIAASALSGRRADGRFLFLSPSLDADARVFSSPSDDGEFSEAFEGASARILAAWDRGAFFPRLVEGEKRTEPRSCEYCDVKDACLRGDSGARSRLVRFADDRAADGAGSSRESAEEGESAQTSAERALLGLFDPRGSAV